MRATMRAPAHTKGTPWLPHHRPGPARRECLARPTPRIARACTGLLPACGRNVTKVAWEMTGPARRRPTSARSGYLPNSLPSVRPSTLPVASARGDGVLGAGGICRAARRSRKRRAGSDAASMTSVEPQAAQRPSRGAPTAPQWVQRTSAGISRPSCRCRSRCARRPRPRARSCAPDKSPYPRGRECWRCPRA